MIVTRLVNLKKLVLLLIVVLLCSGCSGELYYNFGENKIESKFKIEYNTNEFNDYINNTEANNNLNLNDSEVKSNSEMLFSSYKIAAFKDMDTYTYQGNLEKKIDKFTYTYTYDYNYNDFKNNNIFNSCFSAPIIKEDSNAYYYTLYGDYTCRYAEGMKLIIDAPNKLLNSNSSDVQGSKATWVIKQEANDIYFSISKDKSSGNFLNKIYIVAGVFLGIMIVITLFLVNKLKNL